MDISVLARFIGRVDAPTHSGWCSRLTWYKHEKAVVCYDVKQLQLDEGRETIQTAVFIYEKQPLVAPHTFVRGFPRSAA
jgi:hypothetical protein